MVRPAFHGRAGLSVTSSVHYLLQRVVSDVHRKTAEAIAVRFGKAPRTLQRFLQSVKWDEEKLRDRCQQSISCWSRPASRRRREV
jgi:hypothetical protein